jgi:tetratricopeptide (TPR) repeat protein
MPDEMRYVEKRSESAREHLAQAARYQEQGLVTDAISELEKAVRYAPDKALVYRELALLYRDQRQAGNAIANIKKAIKAEPADTQSREMLLEILMDLNRFDEAIEESKELLRFSARNLCARDVLSIAYLHKGMIEKALQVTAEMIKIDPMSPDNHFKKAVLHQQKGDVASAIHEFTRALEMGPDDETAQHAMHAIEMLDSYQLRNIIMLAAEDHIFRAKLNRDPQSAVMERGYFLSYSGMSTLGQMQFDDIPQMYSDAKKRHYN